MRILYVTCANVAGGANISLLNLIREMMTAGHDVRVITVTGPGRFLDMLDDIHCPYQQIRLRYNVYPSLRNPLRFLPRLAWMIYVNHTARRPMREAIRQFRPDIVHTNVGVIGVAHDICAAEGIPHVWHIREYQTLDFGFHYFPYRRTFLRKTHARDNYNVAITRALFTFTGLRKSIDRTIYNGIFPRALCERPIVKDKDDYILFAGRIEEAKGALDVIRAFSRLHEQYPHIQLRLAGQYQNASPYYRQCATYVVQHNLSSCISFLGDRKDIYSLMSRARMIVVASRFEGFGRITAEAMANGCPVVGRNTAGTKEQFDNGLEYTGGEIGLRFSSDEEMLQQMRFALEHDCSEMTERARRTVLHFYTSEENASRIEAYYKDILDHKV